MRIARLATLLATLALAPLALAPLAARAADAPAARWDGIWAGLGTSATSTTVSLPGPQPFFTDLGLTGPDSTTARGTGLDLSVSRLWQRKSLVYGIEASASRGGADFSDRFIFCADCARLTLDGTVAARGSLRGLLGTVRPDGTLWFLTLGATRGRADLTRIAAVESRPGTSAAIIATGPMHSDLHGISFGLGLSRPLGPRGALRMEVTQDRLTGPMPALLGSNLGPDLDIRSTRLALSYQRRF